MDSNFVHIDEPIALAMTMIPNSSTVEKAVARAWAYQGLRDIGPGQHWLEDCVLYPDSNLSMRKPDNMYKIRSIALFKRGSDGTLTEQHYSYRGLGRRIHSNRNQLAADGQYDPASGAPIDLSEDAYFLHLGSNGSDVYCAKISYWKLPIDAQGMPLIAEYQVLAIALFIRWMWSLGNPDKGDRQLSRMDYLSARTEARGKAKLPSGLEMDQAAKEFSSLLSTVPTFKQF